MKKLGFSLFLVITAFTSYSQTEGNVFFGSPIVHTVKFTFPYSNYTDSLTWSYTNDTYIRCDVEVDGTLYPDCGAKWKGNSSYSAPGIKKSFKIDFNEFISGQSHDGLKKLNLNNGFKDPSFLREKLTLDFYVEHNLPAPRCTYVEVYINGTLWGLYTGVEEVDKTFLNRWFGDDRGNLFKGDPTGDLKWMGSTPSLYYTKYELKTNEITNDWTDLVQLINIINNSPSGSYTTDLSAFFDVDTYVYQWAAEVLFANLDSYTGSGHNYYVYHDSLTNKFHFINWDVNEAFGEFSMGMTISQLENLAITYIPSPSSNRPLHEKMLANGFQDDLYNAVCDLVNIDWSIWNLEWKIDSLADAIRPYVYADPNKFYSNANFESNISSDVTFGSGPGGGTFPGIKSFLINRREALYTDLTANGCVVGIDEVNQNSTEMYPNPFVDLFTISVLNEGLNSLQVLNLQGQRVYTAILSQGQNTVNLGSLTRGTYIIELKNSIFETVERKVIVKQ